MLRNTNEPQTEVIFNRRPSKDDKPVELPLIRVPATGICKIVILSKDVVGANLHYWRNRSEPCHGDGCEACMDGQSPRWRGYVVIQSQRTKARAILELTPAAMEPIDEYFADHATLRGAEVAIERQGGKINGRLRASIRYAGIADSELPKAHELEQILLRLWGYASETNLDESTERKIRRDRHARGDWGESVDEVTSGTR